MYIDLDRQVVHDLPEFAARCADHWLERSRDTAIIAADAERFLGYYHTLQAAIHNWQGALIDFEEEMGASFTATQLRAAYLALDTVVGETCQPFYIKAINMR